MWKPAAFPANEEARLAALAEADLLDTPPDERLDRITRMAQRFYQADVALIGFVDAEFQWLISLTSDELAPRVRRRVSVCNAVVEAGEPLVIGDLKADPRLAGNPIIPNLPMRFYAGVPLRTEEGETLGTLCVLKREPQDAASFDTEPLADFAAMVMDAIALRRHNTELARMSRTDELTGLPNRRGFDETLDRAVRRSRRTEMPMALLMFDLDHFKALNDGNGHLAGDDVLRGFARILQDAAARSHDTACRYGGEEFAMVLEDTDIDGARHVGEIVRRRLRQAGLHHPASPSGIVTTSIGMASGGDGSPLDAEILISHADAALYAAKRAGRDQLLAHGERQVFQAIHST